MNTSANWILTRHPVGPLLTNAYLLASPDTSEALLFDPGDDAGVLLDAIEASGCRLVGLIGTHGHFDHIGAAAEIQSEWDLPLRHHPAEAAIVAGMNRHRAMYGFPPATPPRAAGDLADGVALPFAGGALDVRHVPGHSPGHLLFAWEGNALVGDLIFADSVGRTDLPGGDAEALARSIRTVVYALPDATVLHPGHGVETTVGRERVGNPFVRDL